MRLGETVCVMPPLSKAKLETSPKHKHTQHPDIEHFFVHNLYITHHTYYLYLQVVKRMLALNNEECSVQIDGHDTLWGETGLLLHHITLHLLLSSYFYCI